MRVDESIRESEVLRKKHGKKYQQTLYQLWEEEKAEINNVVDNLII